MGSSGARALLVTIVGEDAARTQAQAFVAGTRIVHGWRRLLSMDPGLPAPFLPHDRPADRARRVLSQRYHRWAGPADRWWATANAPGAPTIARRTA